MNGFRFCLLVLSSLLLQSCATAQDIKPASLDSVMAQTTIQLVDVRTPEEFEEGHLKGALLIDVSEDDFAESIESLDKEKPVYVYCRSGKRSSKAAGIMKEKGFKQVFNLDGGIEGWEEAGKPVVRPSE